MTDTYRQIEHAMTQAGIAPPHHIDIDGELHRFKTTGKDKSGWYVLHGDAGIVAGRFGDWKTGADVAFREDVQREISPQEQASILAAMALAKKTRDEAMAKRRQEAASSCDYIYSIDCTPASQDHPYLQRKGIKPHGAKVAGDGRLVVPLYKDGVISSVQYIASDSSKLYAKDGATKGAYWWIGDTKGADKLYIAEGFATAATVHEITGAPCIVAYSASNLVPVSQAIRNLHPLAELIIVADNDKSGTGQKYADQASAKTGASVITPPIEGDVNDYHQAGHDAAELLNPPKPKAWLDDTDHFLSDFKPMSWLIKGILPKSSAIMLFGPSGAGKSFLIIDWMMHIASHRDWQGHKTRGGHVVYLAGEGHHGIRARMKAWLQHHNTSPKDIDMHISRSACDLNTPGGITKTMQEISATNKAPSLIVVDTVNRFLDGDENQAKDVRGMMNNIELLKQTYPSASVVLVHHTGVATEAQGRARGSSAWKASMEVELAVTPKGEAVELTQPKAKDGKPLEPWYYTMQDVILDGLIDEDGEEVTSAVVVSTDAPEEPKKETKNEKALKLFERAWWHSGCEWVGGQAYISRSAFVCFLVDQIGKSESSAKQYTKPSFERGPIFELLTNGVIESKTHGWVILDNVINSSLKLQSIKK